MSTLFISDLDGTLLGKDGKPGRDTVRMINDLIDRGVLFTAATARSVSSHSILRELGVRIPAVNLNGVLIYDPSADKYSGSTPIDTQSAREVLDIMKAFDRMSFIYRADEEFGIHVEFEKLSNETEKQFFEARKDSDYKSFAKVDRIEISDDDRPIYFTMVDTYERLSPIHREISRIKGVRAVLYRDNYSDLFFLEVFSINATKALGMKRIKELTGADRVVAFGDNLNDIEMLRSADVGIAVRDAVSEVRDAADVVIGNSFEDGVARWLTENADSFM